MHTGSGREPARVAMERCSEIFHLLPTSEETRRLVAADWLEDLGYGVAAAAMREGNDFLFESKKGDGDGDGSGYGSGDGYGYGYGSGSGDGDGYGYGYGSGDGDGYGYGYGSS